MDEVWWLDNREGPQKTHGRVLQWTAPVSTSVGTYEPPDTGSKKCVRKARGYEQCSAFVAGSFFPVSVPTGNSPTLLIIIILCIIHGRYRMFVLPRSKKSTFQLITSLKFPRKLIVEDIWHWHLKFNPNMSYCLRFGERSEQSVTPML